MSSFYKSILNLHSHTSRKTKSTKSISLPVHILTQPREKKQHKSVKFPSNVLLQQAIIDGDVQEMKQLINDYGKHVVNEPEPTGLPPVMRCVFEGQLAPLRLLVKAGADMAARDGENWTVLHVAASMDDTDAAKLVLNNCTTRLTQVRNVDGERPIDLAESTDMTSLLKDADLRANKTESRSGTESTIIDLVQKSIAKNKDCKSLDAVLQSSTGYDSLLHLAASKNYLRLASYLLSHTLCELEMGDRRGWTALQTAVHHKNMDVMLLLVKSGALLH